MFTIFRNPLLPAPGIYPLLREWQCGHLNHEVPRLLRGGEPGRGRVVIDVGLGFGAEETLGAVENGFVVFAFEPLPANVEAVEGRLTQLIPGRFLVVRLERREQQQPGAQGAGGGGWRVPELAPPAEPEKGFAFIIHAGLDDGSRTTAHMPAAGLPSHTETVGDSGASDGGATTVPVPLLKLDDALPAWAAHGGGDRQQALLLKIDTQGWELRVLRGSWRNARSAMSYTSCLRGSCGGPARATRSSWCNCYRRRAPSAST